MLFFILNQHLKPKRIDCNNKKFSYHRDSARCCDIDYKFSEVTVYLAQNATEYHSNSPSIAPKTIDN